MTSSTGFAIKVVTVAAAGVMILGSLLMGLLAVHEIPIPDALDRLTFAALTGLLGLLAKTSSTPEPAVDVNVVNEPEQPVPVEATG